MVPGRSTRVDSGELEPPSLIQPKRAPIQAQGGGDTSFVPTEVQVDQYAPGTDTTQFNDCGPAVVLMIVRTLHAEAALDKLVRKHDSLPEGAPVSLQQRLNYIRSMVDNSISKKVMDVRSLQNALYQILRKLKIDLPEGELRKMIVSMGDQLGFVVTNDMDTGVDKYNDEKRPTAKGSARRFLEANCGNGSAVIVLGKPTAGAWGWGGMEDPDRRRVPDPKDKTKTIPQDITDSGRHFVLVWSPSAGVYTVLDPAWKDPRENQTIDQVLAFIHATGSSAIVSMVTVPFARLRAHMAAQQQKRADAAAPSEAASPRPASGPGTPLPRLTLGKMQRAFGADFSAVRVHEDDRAVSIGALGYTQGNDLHFAPGAYRPGTPEGDRLIGHELAHVVQQRQGRVPMHATGVTDDPALEAEADSLGDRAEATTERAARGDGEPPVPQQPLDQTITPLPGPIDVALLQQAIDAYVATPGGVKAIRQDSPYGQAVLAVWQVCNDHLPPKDVVQEYAKSGVESELKRRTIGLVAARRARLEFLIGWMLQGGIHMSPQNWENGNGANVQGTDSSANSGTIVDKYTGFESGYGLRNNDWCGMFVGFAFRHAGMKKGDPAYNSLASVPRALEWVRAQVSLGTAGLTMTPDEIWSGARVPQAGDVVILEQHVAMVERFDSTAKRIDTIDGNVGLLFTNDYASNGVSGASYTATGGPMQILLVYRPGLEAFGATPAPAATATRDNTLGDALVHQLDEACGQLTDLYQKLQLAGAVDNRKSVAQIASDIAAASH